VAEAEADAEIKELLASLGELWCCCVGLLCGCQLGVHMQQSAIGGT
jgi:hypothetical protein